MSLEKFSEPEDDELEALGLSLEDVPEEVASKEHFASTLIEKLAIRGLPENDRNLIRKQLRMVDQDLANIKNLLLREGHHVKVIAEIEELRDKIGIALAS